MADDEPDLSGNGGGGGNPLRAARAKFPIDAKAIKEVNAEFNKLKGHLKDIHKTLIEIKRVAPGVTGLAGAGGGSGGYMKGMETDQLAKATGTNTGTVNNDSVSSKASLMKTALQGAFPKLGGGGGGGTGAGAAATAAGGTAAITSQVISAIGGAIGDALNKRVESGYSYSLSADKMNMMYQQMTGMSQLQVQQNFRQPLTNYRLGPTGINDLMAMQASTGINAINQASSIDAIRSLSGYGYSTEDAARMIQGLGSATTANRMMMMMGGGLYGPGGQENSAFSVVQKIAQRTGLTSNQNLAQSALRQGSITRQRLSYMGLSQDMQDTVIQYGLSQQQFAAKGGTGMYDPSNPAHRSMMGVQDTFASEVEDTAMSKVKREEQFYRKQVDNFADLERQTQSLTKKFGELEDFLSGVIGTKISNNPVSGIVGGVGSSLGMGMLSVGGAMMAAPGVGTAAGAITMGIGGLILGASKILGGSGDAPTGSMGGKSSRSAGGQASLSSTTSGLDPNMRIPAYSGTTTVGALMNNPTFTKLHPTMKKRALKIIKEGRGAIGIGEGYRSPDTQRTMFLQRYKRTDKDTGIFWDGSYWEHVSGAAAAPPGQSFHQIGLAIDFTYTDVNLFHSIAHRNGLKTFENVNNEPWHAQPVELSNGWGDYVDAGMPWGNGGQTAAGIEEQRKSRRVIHDGHTRSSGSGALDNGGSTGGVETLFGMSIGQMVAAQDSLVPGGGSFGTSTGVSSPSYVSEGSATTSKALSGTLSGKEIVKLLRSRGGLSGDDLVKGVAISFRESRWNTRAFNGNANTKDKSYGLFQINMIEPNGAWLRPRIGISKNEELFDAYKNVDAMKFLREDGIRRGDSWYHWGGYKGMAGNYSTDMAMAARTVQQATKGGRGDAPVFSGGGSAPFHSGSSTFNAKEINVTIAPNITVQGGGGPSYDARRLAKELAPLIERETRAALMRSN